MTSLYQQMATKAKKCCFSCKFEIGKNTDKFLVDKTSAFTFSAEFQHVFILTLICIL